MKNNDALTLFILVIFLLAGLISCEKEGLGGKGEISGSAVYETKTLKPAVFYIKYGASSSPGTDVSLYDASSASDAEGKFHFKELNEGHYYIYAVGTENGQTVAGGIHVELDKNEPGENMQINVAP